MRVQFLPVNGGGGCAHYRLMQQMTHFIQNPNLGVTPIYVGNWIQKVGQAIIYAQSLYGEKVFEDLLKFKVFNREVKIIIDYDDLCFSEKSDLNSSYNIFLRDVDPVENRRVLKKYLHEVADMITVTNDNLKEEFSSIYPAERIRVIPNYLSIRDWAYHGSAAVPRDRVFFYSGSASHFDNEKKLYGDFTPALANYLHDKNLIFQGDYAPWFCEKVAHVPWTTLSTYSRSVHENTRYAKFTLAPLTDNRFNRCKSPLKYLESCAIGRVCLVSYFAGSPYSIASLEQKIPERASIKEIEEIVGNAEEKYSEILEYQYDLLSNFWLDSNINKYKELFDDVCSIH